MFTQKHYKAIAEALKEVNPRLDDFAEDEHPEACDTFDEVVDALILLFGMYSEKFDEEKFIKAIGG